VALESGRLMAETLKASLARRALTIGAPIVPLAYEYLGFSSIEEQVIHKLTPTTVTFLIARDAIENDAISMFLD
jgi:hypothetical protein